MTNDGPKELTLFVPTYLDCLKKCTVYQNCCLLGLN